MRLEWLDDILAVADTGSLSEAADLRRLTQSAFSRRIQHIESQLGVELFDRSRKPVKLRPNTANQLPEITRLANELRQLTSDLKRGDQAAENRVILACQHALTAVIAPELVHNIQERSPQAYIRLRSANLDECFGLLLAKQADIAILYRLQGQPHLIEADYIESLVLGHDRLTPVYARDRVEQLNAGFRDGRLPIIAYPSHVFLGQTMAQEILPAVGHMTRIEPQVETALTLAACELALSGIGVAWVPLSLARPLIDAGRLINLSASLPACDLDVMALRLRGSAAPVAGAVWDDMAQKAEVSRAIPSA